MAIIFNAHVKKLSPVERYSTPHTQSNYCQGMWLERMPLSKYLNLLKDKTRKAMKDHYE